MAHVGAKAVENVLAMILVVAFEFGNMLWVTEARADQTVYEEQCQFACKVQQTKETSCGGLDNIPTWMISVGTLTYTTLVVGLVMGATSFWADYRHRQQLFRFQPEAMPARNSNIFAEGPQQERFFRVSGPDISPPEPQTPRPDISPPEPPTPGADDNNTGGNGVPPIFREVFLTQGGQRAHLTRSRRVFQSGRTAKRV